MSSPYRKVFGQSMSKKKNKPNRYRRQMGSKNMNTGALDPEQEDKQQRAQAAIEWRRRRKQEGEELDTRFGYSRLSSGESRSASVSKKGYIFNILQTTVAPNSESSSASTEKSGLDLYFITETNSTFKCTIVYRPYFYVLPTPNASYETLMSTLMRLYEVSGLVTIEIVHKTDLDQINHLSQDQGRKMLKLSFENVQQLVEVRDKLRTVISKNQQREKDKNNVGQQWMNGLMPQSSTKQDDPMQCLMDMREYDVPYLIRISTDLDIRCGAWYTVTQSGNETKLTHHPHITRKADPKILAFDIECTKAPLKFPNAAVDSIFMISYMISGLGGFLIINREIVSSDISDFEYTPKPQYPGPFHIFNEKNEEDLIRRFLSHYQEIKPQIVVTYNGDFFDWPFLQTRAEVYNLSLRKEIGIEQVGEEYRGRCCVHLDAFHWVRRDSYLPQGSQGLKAVTKYKLGYDPVEVDPEDMVRYASEKPIHMATYSVSDAVATFYLYEKYVHMFIFSLCTIIPMGPEDVLRKGSGTLCETLLMVEAYKINIICPNKHQSAPLTFTPSGHLLESETYIGGKVECLETGVYRSDIEYDFSMIPSAFQSLIDNIDRDLTFAIEVEEGKDRGDITNYDEIRCNIIEKLEALRDDPVRKEKPFIYHLDVGAMYPNIILTNRLQPSAIVDDATCAACDFNLAKNGCKRKMDWVWRGDFTPSSKSEFERVKEQLNREMVNGVMFAELPEQNQATKIRERLKQYSKIAYKKTKVTEEVLKKDTVCMRENDFYVETVRNFRDRRYEYKKMTKKAKMLKSKAEKAGDAVAIKEAGDSAIVYDSLQIAHKCILNSFYGYVMRKGARWRSMEMAGIVTKTGADLITQARKLVEQIGRPLELDTDGIWCILPRSFPDSFSFKTKDGSKIKVDYPCLMLNADVHENFTNHQYQTLIDPVSKKYETRSECSIFFEVDGPYRCMVLPSSLEEGKLLKKRYAVFNHDGSLAELKGFELKRRGELELVKTFQSQVFEKFLDGDSLAECYQSVAQIANHWMDILDSQGESLDTGELFDLISENRSMSRQLEDYGDQKGTSQTTARRLGEFLGAEIIKDKGLNCKFIIAERPYGAPVTERAIPTAIWKSEPAVMKHYLRKWLKSPQMDDFDVRSVLDWEYYKDRLGKTIQKIITIPAALQKVPNPVPRIIHPEWLQRTVRRLNDKYKQQNISKMFEGKTSNHQPSKTSVISSKEIVDIEDMASTAPKTGRPIVHRRKRVHNLNEINFDDSNANKTKENKGKEQGKTIVSSRQPLTKENYDAWLTRKKQIWRTQRRDRHYQLKRTGSFLSGSNPSNPEKKQRRLLGNMQTYIRDAAKALIEDEWQVIEIREQNDFSGDFVMWVMLGNDSLQRISLKVPRTVYVNSRVDLKNLQVESVKKVDKRLPHNARKKHLYEVSIPENKFRKETWWVEVFGLSDDDSERVIESVYQQGTPLMFRTLVDLGCICKLSRGVETKGQPYVLKHLSRVERPSQGEYLHSHLSYRRLFLYESLQGRNKTGIVALFVLDGGSGEKNVDESQKQIDISGLEKAGNNSLKLNALCTFWVVKPGKTKGQISESVCEVMFNQMVSQIRSSGVDNESDYACLSSETKISFNLNFVSGEEKAFKGVQDMLTNYHQEKHGPTFLLVNTTKPIPLLRKTVPSCNEFPLVPLPFPPGPAHNQSSPLPALNWEPLASQLCMEAYLFMGVISYPKRVKCARFGNVPIANLGLEENLTLYDLSFARFLQSSRSLFWASELPGKPDLGGSIIDRGISASIDLATTNIWNEDEEKMSPTIITPGAYRHVCVEIDIHDLAIAALTDFSYGMLSFTDNLQSKNEHDGKNTLSSFGNLSDNQSLESFHGQSFLGDELSCATSFQVLRAMVQSWLTSAYSFDNTIANDLLHNLYRLINSPSSLLHDPALQRLLQSLMKTTFYRLLGELQRLGAKIISASFNRVILSTNKNDLAAAQEYTSFVISTIQQASESQQGDSLEHISLRPLNYWTHFVYLDEFNYGGIRFESRELEDEDDADWAFNIEGNVIVPTVVSGWNMMQYLSSEIEQEYFRNIIGRFSKDIYRKQIQLQQRNEKNADDDFGTKSKKRILLKDELSMYSKKLISSHFSLYLTRAVGEILKDGGGQESFPTLPGSHLQLTNPALEFVKNVLAILEVDTDVQQEVHILKKSLLAQIGIQEYAEQTIWKNPCASFVLPDVYCSECNDCRDLNLCVISPHEEENEKAQWLCPDCDAPYDADEIEWRLVDMVNQKSARYQLQDLRCSKTKSVAIRPLAKQSECSAELNLDLSKEEFVSKVVILRNLARYHELDYLLEITNGLLESFEE